MKAGAVCDTPVISVDVFPTMLEMAGADAKAYAHCDGVSLAPLLRGETKWGRDTLFWHYPHYSNQGGFPGAAVRVGDWKLVERFEDGRVHLYNLKDDIGERRDVAKMHPDRVEKMRATLHAWYREVDAKFLAAKPNGPQPWRP